MNQVEGMDKNALPWTSRKPRIAILVLGCLEPVYDHCIQTIRASWGTNSTENTDIFYVYGTQNDHPGMNLVDLEKIIGQACPALHNFEVWVSGDIILCGASDVYAGQSDCILRKRLIAFEYLANQLHYDYVYTVCAASYVDVNSLQRYVSSLPALGVYHGPLGVHEPSQTPFVSGASLLLSRDIAGDLADHAKLIVATNMDLAPDDVAIGRWIARHYCEESSEALCTRISAGEKASSGETFVVPLGGGMEDFVWEPIYSQTPRENAYHYHFHSARIWEMENFHRRFFAPQGER